jgi:hypothetical protein
MPPITGDHSLFANSSTRYTMAFTCDQVANNSLGSCRRCIGLTSFPKVPIWLACQKMGLGTFFPPRASGNSFQTMTRNDYCAMPFGHSSPGQNRRKQALAAYCSRWFRRTFTLHFPYPLSQHPRTFLLTSVDTPHGVSVLVAEASSRVFIRSSAQINYSRCTCG